MIDFGLYLTYALLAIATLAALIFPIIYLARHPKEAKQTLIGIGGMILIFLISYLIADSTVPAGSNISESTSKLVSAALTAFYILFGLAIIAAVFSEISRIMK